MSAPVWNETPRQALPVANPFDFLQEETLHLAYSLCLDAERDASALTEKLAQTRLAYARLVGQFLFQFPLIEGETDAMRSGRDKLAQLILERPDVAELGRHMQGYLLRLCGHSVVLYTVRTLTTSSW
jgi:outer membrane protein TolC